MSETPVSYREEAAKLLHAASEDNERRAREAAAMAGVKAAPRVAAEAQRRLREVSTRRVVIAFGFIAADAVSAIERALRGDAPETTEDET